jgi:hypothetical protein
MDFKDTVKYVEFDDKGRVSFIGGICTAKDFRKNKENGGE